MTPVVISLCDLSGVMVQPWAEAGYECWCVDTRHSIRKPKTSHGITYVWGDVRTWCPPSSIRGRIAILFAFPPCTHVAVSDARDFRTKGTALLRDSLELFAACEYAALWSGVPFMIENPVGKFSDHMGRPDFIFQPWQYGDLWTKKTCLWIGNGFRLPTPECLVPPPGVRPKIFLEPPSDDRADIRSETPPAFARAIFRANHPLPTT
jgi:hypothetical protein